MTKSSLREVKQEIREEIEMNIDLIGFSEFISLVSQVCGDKFDHVRTNWQDEVLAETWNKAGHNLDEIAARFINL